MRAILSGEPDERKAMTETLIGDALRLVLAPNPSAMTERGTNTWIVGRGEVAVIDPGPVDEGHLAAILAALEPGERVSHIVVTHAHRDHSGLAPALSAATGAKVWAFGTAYDGRHPQMAALGPLGPGGEGIDAGFVPDRRLGDAEAVGGPGWELEAIHTPGHLGNHLCLAWGALCFTGDHVMGWSSSVISPPEGDMTAYMASLGRLQARTWRAFLPGHGAVVEDPAGRLAELVAHRRRREAEILAVLAEGPHSVTALARRIYSTTPPALLAAAERNTLAHLIDLVERKLVSHENSTDMETPFRRL
jgi:glyoxylase-like metal-dependent hydrolase (beta-lactamase superfamily II)